MTLHKPPLLLDAILANGVIFLSISLFSPAEVYYANLLEFQILAWEIISSGVAIAGALTVLSAILLLIVLKRLSKSSKERVLCLLMSVGLGLFLQGTYLGWSYGVLDGGTIDWSAPLQNSLGLLMWVTVIFVPQIAQSIRSFSNVRAVCTVLLITQGALLAVNLIRIDQFPSLKTYQADMAPFFDFSSERNVVVLILDEFQCDVFAEIVEETPSLSQSLAGFTFFRNTLAPSRHTFPSIPAMLTGVRYENSVPIPIYLENSYLDNSLPKQLIDNNIRTEVFPTVPGTVLISPDVASNAVSRKYAFEEYWQLVKIGLIRSLPPILKRYVYEVNLRSGFGSSGLETGEVKSFKNGVAKSKAQTQETVFKFFHLKGMHVPLKFDENLRDANVEYDRENYKRQAVGVLGIVELFLSKMKELGIYRRSLIIIAGDHGSGRTKDMWIQATEPDANGFNLDKARGCPLLLAKPLNSKQSAVAEVLKVSSAPVALTDVPITVIEELGIEDARSNSEGLNINSTAYYPAKSLFSVAEFEERPRRYDSYRWDGFNPMFLSAITEFIVYGDVWQDRSWKKGKELLPTQ